MQVHNVSFGKVYAVTGTKAQVEELKDKMKYSVNDGSAMFIDVTKDFVRSKSEGVLGSAVRNGESALLCITGEDVKKIKNNDKNWNSLEKVLTHISEYLNIRKLGLSYSAMKIK